MTQPVVAMQQSVAAQSAQDAAVSAALSVLSEEVWTVVWLLLAGVAAGMALVGVLRLFMSNVEGDGPKAWEDRHLLLTRLGAGASGVLTMSIELGYLLKILQVHPLVGVPAAVMAALLAAVGNKPLFKPVKAIWKWAMGALARRIESSGGDASDLDETRWPKP